MKLMKKKTVMESPLKDVEKHELVGNKPTHSYSRDIAIDLGTAKTTIVMNGLMVADEPSVVAYDTLRKKVTAVGTEAQEMFEKSPKHIEIIHPLQEGNINDDKMTEKLLKGILKGVNAKKPLLWRPRRAVVCTPAGINKVEQKAVCKCAKAVGARRVKTIQAPLAAALGVGIDVQKPVGNFIVVIGGGTTDIAAISSGGIVKGCTLRIGGETFNEEITEYVKKQRNLIIGHQAAEEMMHSIGAVVSELENKPQEYTLSGRDLLTGLAKDITIEYKEIAQAIDRSIKTIVDRVSDILSDLPPQIVSDIARNGILLAGGGALLRGLDMRISHITRCNVRIVDDPIHAAARGAYIALNNFNEFPFLVA